VVEFVVVVVAGDRAVVGLGSFDVLAGFAVLWLIELQPEANRPRHTIAHANRRERALADARVPTVVRAYRDGQIRPVMGTLGSYDQVEMPLATFRDLLGTARVRQLCTHR